MNAKNEVEELPRSRATLRYARLTPMKARRVVDLIRGRSASDAASILQFAPQAASEPVAKLLASAVANAENNHNLDVDALVVAEASVGKSISMKRFMTRARGRSSRIVKPFSRIRVVVREQEEA